MVHVGYRASNRKIQVRNRILSKKAIRTLIMHYLVISYGFPFIFQRRWAEIEIFTHFNEKDLST